MTISLALVVAVAENDVIGVDGGLAWKISDDLKWFKSVTMGKPIIMGRKTFDSIGRALPGRDNIVVTRASDFAAEGVFVVRSLEAATRLGRECAETGGANEVCVIGGAEIYAQMIDQADRIYLSEVDAKVAGDAYFPAYDSARWVRTHHSSCAQGPKNQYSCEFFILDRNEEIPSK